MSEQITIKISATAFDHLYLVSYENEHMTPHRERVRLALECSPAQKHARGHVYPVALSREDWLGVAEALDVRELIPSVFLALRPEYRAMASAHDRIMKALEG